MSEIRKEQLRPLAEPEQHALERIARSSSENINVTARDQAGIGGCCRLQLSSGCGQLLGTIRSSCR
jgi:hypothetical protein